MQAKKKGAVTIHVDPRYTRTSAACDHHVHIRPETDIAFLSAVIRYILEKGFVVQRICVGLHQCFDDHQFEIQL